MKLARNFLSQESSVFLNFIRLAACELVVVCHFLTKYQPAVLEPSFTLGSTLGGIGVLLFFALSGLLITYSLTNKLQNPSYSFRNFFVDRFSRIYSGLVPALLLTAVFALAIYFTNYSYYAYLSSMQSAPSLQNFALTLGMLERFPVGLFNSFFSSVGLSLQLPSVTPFGFNGILWTLVVEWWIYMIFGWFVIGFLAVLKKRQRSVGYKVAFFVVAALLSIVLLALFSEYSSFIIVWFTGACMMFAVSSSSMGSHVASGFERKIIALLLVVFLLGAAFGVYDAFAWTHDYYSVFLGLSLTTSVFLGILLLNGNSDRFGKLLTNKHVVSSVATGAGFSFTLFLIHYPILIYLNGLNLPIDRFLLFLPLIALINIVAYCIAYFTERRYKLLAVKLKHLLHIRE